MTYVYINEPVKEEVRKEARKEERRLQKEVFRLLYLGKSASEIIATLSLSEKELRSYQNDYEEIFCS